MTEKKTYLSILSVVACFCVIVMHVNNCAATFSIEPHWKRAIFVEGLCNFAVPVFFMISGANLIDYNKRYDTATFFKKRFWKTVVPFVVWSLLGMGYCLYHEIVVGWSLSQLLLGIINVEYVNVYWFFLPLFMAYLTIPVLAAIENKQKVFGYMIVVGTILEFLLPFESRLRGVYYTEYLHAPLFSGWILYLVVGYYITHFSIAKWMRGVIYLLGIGAAGMLSYGTYWNSQNIGGYFGDYKGFINLPVLLYASAILLLFRQMEGTKIEAVLGKIVKPVVSTTLGVYLLHRFVLELVYRYTTFDETKGWQVLLVSVGVFLASAVVVKLMQKVPVLRRIVP